MYSVYAYCFVQIQLFFALHSPRILVQQEILQNLLYLLQVNTLFKGTCYHHQKFPLPSLNSRHHLCYFYLLIVSTVFNQLNSSLVPILSSKVLHKCPTSQW